MSNYLDENGVNNAVLALKRGAEVTYVGSSLHDPGYNYRAQGLGRNFSVGERVLLSRDPEVERSYRLPNAKAGGGFAYIAKLDGTGEVAVFLYELLGEEPKPLQAGDHVVWSGVVQATKMVNTEKMYVVRAAIPDYNGGVNGGLVQIEGFTTRYYANRWRRVDPKTYKPIEYKFKVGDKLVLKEKFEQNMRSYTNHFLNVELVVTNRRQTENTASTGQRGYEVVAVKSGSTLGTYFFPESWFDLKPDGWEPRAYKVDLSTITATQVGLTTHGFHTCCGAKILYSFHSLGSSLRDAAGHTVTPHTPVTEEMMEAAIKNTCRLSFSKTGVVLSVLAVEQIEKYGPILERCGFQKINEYPNLNHGTNHMNALYAYFCHENQTKAKEEARAFA